MTAYNLNEALPHITIPLGEYILDELKARKMTQKELAAALGIPASRINEVIKGKRPLSATLALSIEEVIGIPAHILLSLQSQYELDQSRMNAGNNESTLARYF